MRCKRESAVIYCEQQRGIFSSPGAEEMTKKKKQRKQGRLARTLFVHF